MPTTIASATGGSQAALGRRKVFLVYPSAQHPIRDAGQAPHLSLLALAAQARRSFPELSFQYFDGHHLPLSSLEQRIRAESPAVLALSVDFTNYENGLRLAEEAKKNGAKVILGGNHAHSLSPRILRQRQGVVDAISLGSDGEAPFVGFLDHAFGNRSLADVPGIAYFDLAAGRVVARPVQLVDLDTLPAPAYDLIDIQAYFQKQTELFGPGFRMMQVYSLKGCTNQFRCSFCGRYNDGMRTRDPEAFMREVLALIDQHGLTEIWDRSDTFLHRRMLRRVYEYLESIPPGKNPFAAGLTTFKTYGRGDQVDPEMIRFLRALNFRILFIGFESGDNRMLYDMRKINDKTIDLVAQYRSGTERLMAAGIEVDSSFILGLPGENRESLANTRDFISWLLKTGVRKFRLNEPLVLPGTRLNDLLEKHFPEFGATDIFDMAQRQARLYEAYCREGWLSDFGNSVESFRQQILEEVAAIRRMISVAGGACEGSGHYADPSQVYFSEGQEV